MSQLNARGNEGDPALVSPRYSSNGPYSIGSQSTRFESLEQRMLLAADGLGGGISHFSLIDADADQVVPGYEVIAEGDIINVRTLPSSVLNLTAVLNDGPAGSVEFDWNGQAGFSTENNTPYAIGGDESGDFDDWQPGLGVQTVTATTYSERGGAGDAGTPFTLTFELVDEPLARVTTFTLIDADADQPIGTLNTGDVINLATLPTRNLNLAAETDGDVGRVLFDFNGQAGFASERLAPYALFGDRARDFDAFTPPVGGHVVEAAVVDAEGHPVADSDASVRFAVIDDPDADATEASPTFVDFDTDDAGSPLAPGTLVADQYAALGLTIAGDATHPAMIFDSADPTGGDTDLATGTDAAPLPQSNLLILSEDGDADNPDDAEDGGTLTFTFDTLSDLHFVELIDIDDDEADGQLVAFDAVGNVLDTVPFTAAAGDGALTTIPLDLEGVARFQITFTGSAAVAGLAYTLGPAVSTGGVTVTSLSPADGETLVNTRREAIAEFSAPVDPASLDGNSFYAVANGTRVPATIRVSSDATKAWLFYNDPLPASTQVRVIVDGDRATDAAGNPLDANGDQTPGGRAVADFSTLPLTRIPNTVLTGHIFDSENRNPDGSNIPVVGATLTLEGLPGVSAVTDQNGYFELGVDDTNRDGVPDGLPAPDFFVFIDGATASSAPNGGSYAYLGKPFHTTPGQTRQIFDNAGQPFDIFLPVVQADAFTALDPNAPTAVGFGPTDLALVENMLPDVDPDAFARTAVTIAPGSAFGENGQVATQAFIVPVAPDRLPAPLPPNLDPGLVISVQAPGATNFDTPAAVTFPNLEGLLPGEQVLLFSFDHDAGRFVVNGTATVDPDGLTVTTDPGVGIEAPGWHFVDPATQVRGPEETSEQIRPDRDVDRLNELAKEFRDRADSARPPYEAFIGQMAELAEEVARRAADNPNQDYSFIQDVLEKTLNERIDEENFFPDVPYVDLTNAETFSEFFSGIPGRLVDFGSDISEFLTGSDREVITANGATSIGVGSHHFLDHLLPGFYQGLDQRVQQAKRDGTNLQDAVNEVRRQHSELIDEIIPQGWNNLADKGVISREEAAIANELIPFLAEQSREAMIDLYERNEGIDLGPDSGGNGGGFGTDSTATRLVSDRFASQFDFSLESIGSEITAGSSISLTASDGRDLSGVEYLPLSISSDITVSSSGVLSVGSVPGSLAGVARPLWILARSGNQIGLGQFVLMPSDQDGDGISDSAARRQGFDPAASIALLDSDQDGVSNFVELTINSNANLADSDFDGIHDFSEIQSNFSPAGGANRLPQTAGRLIYAITDEIGQVLARGESADVLRSAQSQLSPNTTYRFAAANTSTFAYGEQQFQTGRSGSTTQIQNIVLTESIGLDSDSDGLADEIERVLGTGLGTADTDGDGVSDFAELEQGLNPLDGVVATTGLLASLDLFGEARGVEATADKAYVATGSHGLAIIDASSPTNPIIQGQIDLTGTAVDVGVDEQRDVAAVAAGLSTLLVDVSDAMQPSVIGSVVAPSNQVDVFGGFAYVGGAGQLTVIDLDAGQLVTSLNLGVSGEITGLARAGDVLYAYVSGSDALVSIDVSASDTPRILDTLSVSVASQDVGLFAGNGVVWLAGSGLRTIDSSDPGNLSLISDADNFFTAKRIALNGSGLGVLVPDGGNFVQVYDTADPNQTADLVTQFTVPGQANGVAISNGISFIATSEGLQVVNFRPFDTQGIAPTVTIATPVADVDPGTPGLQVFEGTAIAITADVMDDVGVRDAALFVNNQLEATDGTFPYDFSVTAPALSDGVNELRLIVAATDTGGNVGNSNEIVVQIVPDTIPPQLVSVTPFDGGSVPEGNRTLRLRFNETIDTTRITDATFTLTGAGDDGVFDTPDDTTVGVTPSFRDNERLVQLATDTLAIGEYRLSMIESDITDLSGNPLGSGVFDTRFTATEIMSRISGDSPDVLFMVDVSGSTGSGFGGEAIGDVNGDGQVGTILDAQIAGLIVLNQELINLGLGESASVGVGVFTSSATLLDLNPVEPGVQTTASPTADADGDGVRDVEQALFTLRAGGGTDFRSALQRAVDFFTDRNTPDGQGNLVFLSDGQSSNNFGPQLTALDTLGVNRIAFGAGTGASLDLLTLIDPEADRFTTTDELLEVVLGVGGDNNDLDSTMPGDFDGDGSVGQSDLNLVLNNWGRRSSEGLADTWTRLRPLTIVGQTELNAVLNNWGDRM